MNTSPKQLLKAVAASAVLTLAAGTSHAATMLDNLSGTSSGTNGLGTTLTNAINVTSASTMTLDSLSVWGAGSGSTLAAEIFASDGTDPTTLLSTLTPDVAVMSASEQLITFTGSHTFSAGVEYWIEFYTTGGGGSLRTSAAPFSGGASSDLLIVRTGAPGSRSTCCYIPTPGNDGLALQLLGSAVPAPAPLGAGLISLIAVGLVARRRNIN